MLVKSGNHPSVVSKLFSHTSLSEEWNRLIAQNERENTSTQQDWIDYPRFAERIKFLHDFNENGMPLISSCGITRFLGILPREYWVEEDSTGLINHTETSCRVHNITLRGAPIR